MTTEGDGNYHMQRFLEQEGAEVDIQGITNWLLFLLWEAGYDTEERQDLREHDEARKSLNGVDATKKLWGLKAGYYAVSRHLPDLREPARPARVSPARHARNRAARPRALQQRTCGAAKVTWRWASSSTSWSTTSTT